MSGSGDLFGKSAAEQERDMAFAAVAARGGTWRNRALAALSLIRGFAGTGEDIRIKLLMQGLAQPHDQHAWGEFINAAKRLGKLDPTGQYRKMRTKKSHARKSEVYRVLIVLLALLLTVTVAVAGKNGKLGQNEWCWVDGNTGTEFCDYTSYPSCKSANQGKNGTCVGR